MLFFTGRFFPSSHSLFGTNTAFGHDYLASDSCRFHTISQFNRQLITPVFPLVYSLPVVFNTARVSQIIYSTGARIVFVYTRVVSGRRDVVADGRAFDSAGSGGLSHASG